MKNDKQCHIYCKQAYYAMNRVANKHKLEISPNFNSCISMLKWKFPDMALTFTCDNCNKRTSGTLKKCPCKNGYYCCDECQRKHWPVHKDVCPTKKPRKDTKLEFDLAFLPY